MHPRSLWAQGNVCWRCQWRLRKQSVNVRHLHISSRECTSKLLSPPRRALHLTTRLSQGTAIVASPTSTAPPDDPTLVPRPAKVAVRAHLAQWQEEHGKPTEDALSAFGNHPLHDVIQNGLSKLNATSRAAADDTASSREWGTMHGAEGDDMITIGLFMKPGDVVELVQPDREPVLAVFVQQLDNCSQFFSVNGRWAHSIIARVAFAITGCIDPALVQPLVPYLPTDPFAVSPKGEIQVPVHLAAPVTDILERMTSEAEQIYRTNASVLDTAYSSLADQKRTRMMTLGQIAKTLLAKNDPTWKASPAALLAVRKALNHNEFRFKTDRRSHRLTNVFSIRPKDDVHVVETVHGWMREYSEYQAMSANTTGTPRKPSAGATCIIEFLSKARRLVAASRKDRDPNIGSLGPSKVGMSRSTKREGMQVVWDEPFTNTDKQIIQFLQAWVLTNQFVNIHGLVSACNDLIRATACYGEGVVHNAEGIGPFTVLEIKNSTGALFLQEIGVISPFENRTLYDEQLMLPTVKLSRNLEILSSKAEQTRLKPDFQDSMEDLRRDWGSTTIYCVDDADAQEIDDGISIERVQGAASEFWVHVHVANPTAFFDKTHTLSGLAAHMTETVYLPERTYPMLPSWASQGYFSLDRNRAILTFSSRVDKDGNVLETKIQPGIAREIVKLTPTEVSMLLGHESTPETKGFTVGGHIPDRDERRQPTLSAAQLQDLQDMNIVAQRLWIKRKNAGGMYFNSRAIRVSVFESPSRPGLTWNPPSTDRSRRVQGDPIIKVTNPVLQGFVHYEYTPARIVEEMMLLACSSAASWCTERNIPVMYRGTIDIPNADKTASSKEILTKLVRPQLEKYGKVPHNVALHFLDSLSRAILHFAPIPHNLLGLPGYVRVTSPLRRFGDMIAHWQIEAALRYEAQHGKKFPKSSSSSHSQLPFSQRQITDSIVTLSPREGLIKATSSASSSFWSITALHRALYYKEASLPDTFRCVVRAYDASKTPFAKMKGASGLLVDYGYDVVILESEDLKPGDELDVRIEVIDLFYRLITVKPLRLLHRDEDLP
ncbi:RNB-domain-containing protein [Phaeosphaeriaceae sp. SRC1lsM3a]|nr:RNB-domain-containing protein [Stagonospora sp. SRC1lsM3a]